MRPASRCSAKRRRHFDTRDRGGVQLPGDGCAGAARGGQQHDASSFDHAPFGLVSLHPVKQRLLFFGTQDDWRRQPEHAPAYRTKFYLRK